MTQTISNQQLIQSHGPCSSCGSSDAKADYADGHGYCFSCNTYFPPVNTAGDYTYEYLPWRGITKETMAFYGVRSKIDIEGKPIELGFPYSQEAIKIRRFDTKAFYTKGEIGKAGLFGINKFAAGGSKHVTITEGEVDALSLYQVLKSPVVSVQSASSALRDCTVSRSYLNAFERIYLAFDNDAPGKDATRLVAKLFDPSKVFHVKFSNRKDANEYLDAGEAVELRNIWHNAKRYLPENLISSNEDFKRILEAEPQKGFPYPFKKLTDMTYGIRLGETVLFTAQEKVGKTEIMHFIEHKILKETDHNVGAIFLEEPQSRHLQALVGIEIGKPIHLPDHSINPSEAFDTLSKVLRMDDRLYLHTHFGSDDPEVLLDTVRYLVSACGCRFIIIDHLSILHSGLAGEGDERRLIDYISTRLEMMVKELNFALLCVMHVNDVGQTRGSRFPTKTFDITVSINRDLQHPDPIERTAWHLRVLFNRFSSTTGLAGKILFNRDTYSFTELEETDHARFLLG